MLFRVVVLALLLRCFGGTSAKPNFVILFADDLGFGDLSAFGHPTTYSPHLDELMQESRVFTQFYSAACLCSPSRAALLTGRYPVRTGIYPGVFFGDSVGGLPPTEVTLAQALKKLGYKTAHVGKWHLGVGINHQYLPTHHGFDSYLGIPYSQDMCPCYACFYPNDPCTGRCMDPETTVACPLFDNTTIVEQPADLTTLTEKLTARAINFIEESEKAQEPFFLYFAYHHTHNPQFAGKRFRNTTIRGDFGDSIAEMDDSVGQVMATLKRLGLSGNTVVVFTSDNGPSLMRRVHGGNAGLLRCGKATTYEGGMRMPALIHWKNHIAPGKSKELISALDIAPTLMRFARGSLTDDNAQVIDGLDLSNMLLNNASSPRNTFLYYPAGPDNKYGVYAVRYRQYKAHFYTEGSELSDGGNYDKACVAKQEKHDPPLLFDLAEDPAERYPLDPKNHKLIIEKLTAIKVKADETMTWGTSEMKRGKDKKASPCCTSTDCTPFPKCCDCPKKEENSV